LEKIGSVEYKTVVSLDDNTLVCTYIHTQQNTYLKTKSLEKIGAVECTYSTVVSLDDTTPLCRYKHTPNRTNIPKQNHWEKSAPWSHNYCVTRR